MHGGNQHPQDYLGDQPHRRRHLPLRSGNPQALSPGLALSILSAHIRAEVAKQ
jgi:hypothetical protein